MQGEFRLNSLSNQLHIAYCPVGPVPKARAAATLLMESNCFLIGGMCFLMECKNRSITVIALPALMRRHPRRMIPRRLLALFGAGASPQHLTDREGLTASGAKIEPLAGWARGAVARGRVAADEGHDGILETIGHGVGVDAGYTCTPPAGGSSGCGAVVPTSGRLACEAIANISHLPCGN